MLILISACTIAMEDFEDLLSDLTFKRSIAPCIPIILTHDRVMANLELMETILDKNPMQHIQKINSHKNASSDFEVSLPEIPVASRFFCALCNKIFARKDILFRHQKNLHTKSEKIQCSLDGCNKISSNERNHESHLKHFHRLHPKTLKPLQKKIQKDSQAYAAYTYQSDAARNAKRMPTRAKL